MVQVVAYREQTQLLSLTRVDNSEWERLVEMGRPDATQFLPCSTVCSMHILSEDPRQLVLPFSLSGQHKLWKLDKHTREAAENGLGGVVQGPSSSVSRKESWEMSSSNDLQIFTRCISQYARMVVCSCSFLPILLGISLRPNIEQEPISTILAYPGQCVLVNVTIAFWSGGSRLHGIKFSTSMPKDPLHQEMKIFLQARSCVYRMIQNTVRSLLTRSCWRYLLPKR